MSDYAAGEVASAISRHVRIGTVPAEAAMSSLEEFDGWADAVANWIKSTRTMSSGRLKSFVGST